jgi:hypothetical protein
VDFLVAAFLIAHGLIHLSYLSPPAARTASGPSWPFGLEDSWLVTRASLDPGLARTVGTALVATTVILLVAAGLATVGWLVPQAWWPSLVVAGAVASLVTLALFFHPWLVLGIAIDLVLLWAVVVNSWEVAGFGA